MPFQLHGFVLDEFSQLADLAHHISYGDLVDRVCQLIKANPDGRCSRCGNGLQDHDWIDMAQLCSHYSGETKSGADVTRDVEIIFQPPVRR